VRVGGAAVSVPSGKKTFAQWQKDSGKKPANVIDLEEDDGPSKAPWPRGYKTSKQDSRCDASSMALKNTLKSVLADKEEASIKREERRRREKEEQMTNFIEL
jgi:hypothetical protein